MGGIYSCNNYIRGTFCCWTLLSIYVDYNGATEVLILLRADWTNNENWK